MSDTQDEGPVEASGGAPRGPAGKAVDVDGNKLTKEAQVKKQAAREKLIEKGDPKGKGDAVWADVVPTMGHTVVRERF